VGLSSNKNNKSNVSLRCAATMLKKWQTIRNRSLTSPTEKRNVPMSENFRTLYGDSSYQWNSD
jgi:hypothetical protein